MTEQSIKYVDILDNEIKNNDIIISYDLKNGNFFVDIIKISDDKVQTFSIANNVKEFETQENTDDMHHIDSNVFMIDNCIRHCNLDDIDEKYLQNIKMEDGIESILPNLDWVKKEIDTVKYANIFYELALKTTYVDINNLKLKNNDIVSCYDEENNILSIKLIKIDEDNNCSTLTLITNDTTHDDNKSDQKILKFPQGKIMIHTAFFLINLEHIDEDNRDVKNGMIVPNLNWLMKEFPISRILKNYSDFLFRYVNEKNKNDSIEQ